MKDKLNSLIMESMKAGDKIRTNALRAIKTGFMQWETAKENAGKTLDEATEIGIIRKLRDQYCDAAKACNDGKHDELVVENTDIAVVLTEFLPAPVSEGDIYEAFLRLTTGECFIEPIKKNMGTIIKSIKAQFPGADGKIISHIAGQNLK